jgi:hypothetical protein
MLSNLRSCSDFWTTCSQNEPGGTEPESPAVVKTAGSQVAPRCALIEPRIAEALEQNFFPRISKSPYVRFPQLPDGSGTAANCR